MTKIFHLYRIEYKEKVIYDHETGDTEVLTFRSRSVSKIKTLKNLWEELMSDSYITPVRVECLDRDNKVLDWVEFPEDLWDPDAPPSYLDLD